MALANTQIVIEIAVEMEEDQAKQVIDALTTAIETTVKSEAKVPTAEVTVLRVRRGK